MSWIDWVIMAVPMVVVCYIAWKANSYMKGVADFLAAGRCAGRYLVCTASGMASMGVISVVAVCEMKYKAGFAVGWWSQIGTPVWLAITLTGFVFFRYRETRALTLAQFFEMRYSRRFRVFAGILASVSGIINYGIFPAVAGRFFVYFCGLPEFVRIGGLPVPTFAITMLVFLSAALLFVLLGGQLTIMVTDCVQGLFSYAMYLVVAVALLYLFSWSQIESALMNSPANQSLLNPFQTSEMRDFNFWFVLIGVIGGIYSIMAWQGTQGFNCSAASAHEARMGGILGNWRGLVFEVMQTLLAICALTYLTNADFSKGAQEVNAAVSTIANPQIQEQMRVPIALGHLLPVGIKGILGAVMFFLATTNDVSYLHSWGSIVAQDVILPFRKKPMEPRQHLRLLRWCITGVTIYAFCFSLWFTQTQYILMYFAITGAIYLGGAGSVIIGGLYWKRGTAAGAWAALTAGSLLAVGGIVLEQTWAAHVAPTLIRWFPHSSFLAENAARFPINGQYMWAIAMGISISLYIVVSLLTCREDFNMQRLLHRGAYALDANGKPAPAPEKPPRSWRNLLGIDEHFTRGDKVLAICLFCWSMFWFAVFAVVSVWNLIRPWPVKWWSNYWFSTGIVLPIVLGTVTSVWFTIGGIRDLRRLFRSLATLRRDSEDDGRVCDLPYANQGATDAGVVAETNSSAIQ